MPGPDVPLYLLGGRMLVVIPLPLVGNLSVGVAAISTNDLFTVGVLVDPDACPDADVLIAVTERCFAQLFGSGRLGQERTTQRGCSSSYLRLVSVDDALHQVDQLLQFFVRECGDCRRWAEQDGFGGGDRVAPAGRKGNELAATVVGMGTTLDKVVLLELVDDERDVRASRLVELSELAVRQWSRA